MNSGKSLIPILIQKNSNLAGLLSVCNLSLCNTSIISKFCDKVGKDHESTTTNWKQLISTDKEVKHFIYNRTPPRYPIIMGCPAWKTMFSFMLGFEYTVSYSFLFFLMIIIGF